MDGVDAEGDSQGHDERRQDQDDDRE
jgi:hypothetical protein